MKDFYRSFAGGEITPEMFGRLDLSKFQTGLQRAENFIVLPHGPAARRPGTYFGNEAKDSAQRVRLIPFVFSATQAVIIEFGDLYCRFHTENGTVLEATQTISAASNALPVNFAIAAHGYSNGDWLFLQMTGVGMRELNGRFLKVINATANNFELEDTLGNDIDTTASVAFTGGTVARVYTLVSPYTAAQVFSLKYTQDSDVLTLTMQGMAARELRRSGPTSWAFSTVSFVPTLAAPVAGAATPTSPTPTGMTTQSYVVTALAADLVTESAVSGSMACSNNLAIAGNFNTITWSAVTGAVRYYVYKYRGGVYGFIGQTTTLTLVDDNILPDTTVTPPEATVTLNDSAGNYPAAATHFERRRWFAGTSNKPQTVWATRNGTLSNLTASIPSREDDGMEFRIAAQQQNAIKHLVPLVDLVALTVGGEFRIFADGGPAVSPTTISIKPQGFTGANEVQPVLAKSSALYVQAQGARVNELTYEASGTGAFRANDVSLLAPHLVEGYTITELAFQRGAEPALWAVRSDGVLLGMTYVPEQQVFGWHQHPLGGDGIVESVAVIPESNRDAVYMVVRRTVDGASRRYIERMKPRYFGAQDDAFFVDCGLTYDGTPATLIRGLWHLEGEAVDVLADGAVVEGLTVADGAITLDVAASVVHVGFNYVSRLRTLPLALEALEAVGQGAPKNVNEVYIRVSQSSVLEAGPTFDDLRENPARPVATPYDTATPIADGEIALRLDADWSADGSVCIQQARPLPLTVVAMALDLAVGG